MSLLFRIWVQVMVEAGCGLGWLSYLLLTWDVAVLAIDGQGHHLTLLGPYPSSTMWHSHWNNAHRRIRAAEGAFPALLSVLMLHTFSFSHVACAVPNLALHTPHTRTKAFTFVYYINIPA